MLRSIATHGVRLAQRMTVRRPHRRRWSAMQRFPTTCERLEQRCLLSSAASVSTDTVNVDDTDDPPTQTAQAEHCDPNGPRQDINDRLSESRECKQASDQLAGETSIPTRIGIDPAEKPREEPSNAVQPVASTSSRLQVTSLEVLNEIHRNHPPFAQNAPRLPLHHRIWVSRMPDVDDDDEVVDLGSDDEVLDEFWRELGLALTKEPSDAFEPKEFLRNPFPDSDSQSHQQPNGEVEQSDGPIRNSNTIQDTKKRAEAQPGTPNRKTQQRIQHVSEPKAVEHPNAGGKDKQQKPQDNTRKDRTARRVPSEAPK